jgi:NAD(P)-dependent dehydrogenase (short-subunit alcohol dehydrogenase family)
MPAALVTGGSSGIGRAIAADLLAHGWDVTIVSRDPARAGLDGATCVAADLRSEDACVSAVADHRERLGRLDLLVSSAGIGIAGPVDGYATKAWDLQFAVNIRGLYLVTREALPMLREARGLIVNIASVAGLGGAGMLSGYAASKHAVVGYTRTLNEELLADGVRATAICPAFVDTPMTDWVKGSIAPEDMIQPDDIARTVRYLLDLTPACHVPEIAIRRATRGLDSTA